MVKQVPQDLVGELSRKIESGELPYDKLKVAQGGETVPIEEYMNRVPTDQVEMPDFSLLFTGEVGEDRTVDYAMRVSTLHGKYDILGAVFKRKSFEELKEKVEKDPTFYRENAQVPLSQEGGVQSLDRIIEIYEGNRPHTIDELAKKIPQINIKDEEGQSHSVRGYTLRRELLSTLLTPQEDIDVIE